jgi:hypothetical protein
MTEKFIAAVDSLAAFINKNSAYGTTDGEPVHMLGRRLAATIDHGKPAPPPKNGWDIYDDMEGATDVNDEFTRLYTEVAETLVDVPLRQQADARIYLVRKLYVDV